MTTNAMRTITEFIASNFLFREGLQNFDETASLMEAGLVDSTGILELVSFLESEFPIRVADEEIVPENLDTIAAISTYVERKLATVTMAQTAA